MSETYRLAPGVPEPLGVTLQDDGINVAVFSAHATGIDLCLFDADDREVARLALPERSGDVFHGKILGVASGARYGLRAHGPYEPWAGHRFNPAKLLVDPHALVIDRPFTLHPSMFGFVPGTDRPDGVDSAPFVPKALVLAPPAEAPAWAGAPAWDRTSILEVHAKGFSALHPGVAAPLRGTFAGLASPAAIDHFLRLGITSIEILPSAAWVDERHLGPLGLSNYWGYNPVTMLAPDPRLAPGGWSEVRSAVATLNAAGIEVLLDVVYNHSGEGDELGPTLSLRGLDNATYYRLDPANPRRYVDDAGCGNILAADRSPVVRLVLDALRAWVRFGGINGFRFDLMTTLGRRPSGFEASAPIIAAIEQDPLLRTRKLIAEPWDIGPGGYQVGALPGQWGEWNDRYRDDVRRFWRGDGRIGDLATRLTGSSDLFARKRRPSRSINFISAHDGFTLADLVAYTNKRNGANGEQNRDGTNSNYSWNNGVEGPTDDPAVLAARACDQRNLIATLVLSRGTPMFGPGTELGQSQGGNNNAYAQDNAISWLDWSKPDHPLVGFIGKALALRAAHPALSADRFLTGSPPPGAGFADIAWRRPDGQAPSGWDWDHPASPTLIATLAARGAAADDGPEDALEDRVTVVLHAGHAALDVRLPETREAHHWRVALDTSAEVEASPPRVFGGESDIAIAPRSVVVLVEEPGETAGRVRPASPEAIDRLAAAAGIAPDWWENHGPQHIVSLDSKRALLGAMGLATATAGEVRDSLAQLADRAFRPLPDQAHGWAGEPLRLSLPGPLPAALTLVRQDGTTESLRLDPAEAERQPLVGADGRRGAAFALTLPAQPVGRHRILVEGRPEIACGLTVAPRRCFLPDDIVGGARPFGIAAHLYTLRRAGDGGIGDFSTLQALAEAAGRQGAGFIGLNPLHAQFEAHRDRASPYHPSDRRYVDPIYLDVTAPCVAAETPEVGRRLDRHAAALEALRTEPLVDYPAVWAIKRDCLDIAFEAFDKRRQQRPRDPDVLDFAAFVAAGGAPLQRFATFEAIAEARNGQEWMAWSAALRDPAGPAVAAFAEARPGRLRFHLYLQWLCERQFASAAARARAAGLRIGLYRDIAVGTAPDGAEAWAEQRAFARGVSIGAPPDPFSAEGQIWCLPPPNPVAPESIGIFAHLLEANMRHAGALRIDHAMGLQRLFWVPDGARGSEGAYVSYPREANLAELALESTRARCIVIGEDLGTVPEGFRERLGAADVLSYRVLFFERDGAAFKPAKSYPAKAVACVATHDLPTLAGWWAGGDLDERAAIGQATPAAMAQARLERAADKARLAEAVGEAALGAAPEVPVPMVAAVHRFVADTPSVLAMAQVEDLIGERVAVNLPGTDRERPNWRRRLVPDVTALFDTPTAALPQRSRGPKLPT